MNKTTLVLGGGVGGIVTANALREQLAAEHRIIVVDKRAEHVFTPSLLWVMAGWRRPTQITKSLHRMLQPGIEVIQAEVEEINPEQGWVQVGSDKLGYDYLVVALGADLAPEAMPGFSEVAHTPFDLKGAAGIWSALQSFEHGRVAVLVSGLPYKCPAAPYETALLLDDHFRRRGIRGQVEMAVYTPEPAPMGVAGPAMGRAVVGMLEAKGISFNPQLNLTRIAPADKELIFENREPAPFDFLAAVPPHKPPRAVRESPLANEAGWVPVDKHTLATRFDNVYAIGDVTTIILANGKPLPKAGVFAHAEARSSGRPHSCGSQGKASASRIQRGRLLLDRDRGRLRRLRQRRILCRARPPGTATPLGPPVALGQGDVREILAGRRYDTRGSKTGLEPGQQTLRRTNVSIAASRQTSVVSCET